MKSNTEMKVNWQKGAKEAFEGEGFSGRIGLHLEAGITKGGGITGLHLLFGFHSGGQVHIDYRGVGEGHLMHYNDDVTAPPGPEKSHDVPINNYARYQQWFDGPIPGSG